MLVEIARAVRPALGFDRSVQAAIYIKEDAKMLDLEAILAQFPTWRGDVESDSYRDILGVRTRMTYLPPPYMDLAGTLQPTVGAGLHEPLEWAGVLQSTLEAGDTYVCVELGAGWGPFVIGAGRAARARGIQSAIIVG